MVSIWILVAVLSRIPLLAQSEPSKRPLIFVSHLSDNYVSVIDPATNGVIGRIKAGQRTDGVAISPLQDNGYVAGYESNDITVFDQHTGRTLATIPAGEKPSYLSLTADGQTLLIGHESNDGLWCMGTRSHMIVKKLPEGWGPFCQSKTGDKIYQCQIFVPFVDVIDPATLSIVKKIPVGGRPMSCAITPDGRFLYVSNFELQGVQRIDLGSDTVARMIPNVKNPRGIALSPDGKTAYVPDVVNSRLSIVDLTASIVVKTVRVGAMPVAVVLDNDGNYAYVACQSGASVSVVDTRSGTLVRSISVGRDPIQISFHSAYAPPAESLSVHPGIATYPIDSLDAFLMENLCRKKVVMIGDGYHQHGTYMRLVTGLLSRWVDALDVEHNKRKSVAGSAVRSEVPRKVILFLESDSEKLGLRLSSIRNGDVASWLAGHIQLETEWGHLIGGTSVDGVEYAAALNGIVDRIARLNAKDPAHSYDFLIVGPEGVPPYKAFDPGQTGDRAEMRKKALEFQRTKFNWFAHERDQISSRGVFKALSDHPGYKGVLFYGTAHLSRRRENKATVGGGTAIGIDSAYDYFLAHYLDGYLGRDSVAVFFTRWRSEGDESGIVENAHSGDSYDYEVSCRLIPPGPTPIEIMPSRTVLAAFRALVDESEKEGNEHGRMYGRAYATRLYLQLKRSTLNDGKATRLLLDSVRAHTRDTSSAASAWRDVLFDSLIASYDCISTIDSLQNWLNVRAIDSSLYNEMVNLVILNIPGADSLYDLRTPMRLPLDTSMQAFVRSHQKDLVEYFLVNVLRIGTSDEKNRALARLTMLSGESYRSPEEWSEWWRARYR